MQPSAMAALSIRELIPIHVDEASQPEPVGTASLRIAPDNSVQEGKNDSKQAVPLKICLTLEGESNLYRGFETQGIFVATWQPLEKGTDVNVTFFTQDGSIGRAAGVVRWVRDYHPAFPDTTPGMAVELAGLCGDSQSVFDSFAKRREPLFYD